MSKSAPSAPEPEIELAEILGPDFTVYKETAFESVVLSTELSDEEKKKRYFYAGSLHISCQGRVSAVESRALACRAYRGAFWSITLRCTADNKRPDPKPGYEALIRQSLNRYVKSASQAKLKKSERKLYDEAKLKDFLGYCPSGHGVYSQPVKTGAYARPSKKKQPSYLNDIYTLCNELDHALFPQTKIASRPTGLIIITGATDSSKSLITRGLIFLYLQRAAEQARKARQRKPHLITYEDPIEEYYVKDPATMSLPPTLAELESLLDAIYLDYTPREKDTDVGHLSEVTKDALRQTPTLLFVGETRDKDDWKELLQFAGSGHLVVTTSHAGSVVEAMTGIFRDTKTKTPSQRSEIARRILAIMNIRSRTLKTSEYGDIRMLLPALWKRTPQAMNNLIADGLASILPVRGREPEMGYYGRTFFAEKLIADPRSAVAKKLTEEEKAEIRKEARELDIKGE